MKPDPDPHVHFIEELAELMLRWLLAVNAAARARRLAGRPAPPRGAPAAKRPVSRSAGKHRRGKGARP